MHKPFTNYKLFTLISKVAGIVAATLLCACAADNEITIPENDNSTLGTTSATANVSYCQIRYLDAPSTRSFYELFTGEEFTYGRLTMRSQASKRQGMYFFVMFDFDADDIALATQIELTIDTTDNPHPKTYKFIVPETHSLLRDVVLGITGSDWQNPAAKVNAWKLVVKSPTGKPVAEAKSWLWDVKYPQD